MPDQPPLPLVLSFSEQFPFPSLKPDPQDASSLMASLTLKVKSDFFLPQNPFFLSQFFGAFRVLYMFSQQNYCKVLEHRKYAFTSFRNV